MENKKMFLGWRAGIGMLVSFALLGGAAGCGGEDESPNILQPELDEIIPKPEGGYKNAGSVIRKIDGTDKAVKTLVYVEVNDHNPLNAGAYVLADGSRLFDHVVLFAANIRNRNCAAESGEKHGCTQNGLHVHLNENVKHILTNRAKYIKPLQDKGIKVLLGLLGDHDGIGFATMNGNGAGDAGDDSSKDQVKKFVASIKSVVDTYGLDGVDFDDEWASKEAWKTQDTGNSDADYAYARANNPSSESIWVYPMSSFWWPLGQTTVFYRNKDKGIEAANGTLTATTVPQQETMWLAGATPYYNLLKHTKDTLGAGKIVTLYEYNYGRWISPKDKSSSVTVSNLESTVDFALQPWYNRYYDDSVNQIPRAKYSPFAMDVGGGAYEAQNGAPNPPIVIDGNETATGTIHNFATRFKAAANTNAYGVLYFYGLRDANHLLKYKSDDSVGRIGMSRYISRMTQIVFGQKAGLADEKDANEDKAGYYKKDW